MRSTPESTKPILRSICYTMPSPGSVDKLVLGVSNNIRTPVVSSFQYFALLSLVLISHLYTHCCFVPVLLPFCPSFFPFFRQCFHDLSLSLLACACCMCFFPTWALSVLMNFVCICVFVCFFLSFFLSLSVFFKVSLALRAKQGDTAVPHAMMQTDRLVKFQMVGLHRVASDWLH